jgi:hypothetical protein
MCNANPVGLIPKQADSPLPTVPVQTSSYLTFLSNSPAPSLRSVPIVPIDSEWHPASPDGKNSSEREPDSLTVMPSSGDDPGEVAVSSRSVEILSLPEENSNPKIPNNCSLCFQCMAGGLSGLMVGGSLGALASALCAGHASVLPIFCSGSFGGILGLICVIFRYYQRLSGEAHRLERTPQRSASPAYSPRSQITPRGIQQAWPQTR